MQSGALHFTSTVLPTGSNTSTIGSTLDGVSRHSNVGFPEGNVVHVGPMGTSLQDEMLWVLHAEYFAAELAALEPFRVRRPSRSPAVGTAPRRQGKGDTPPLFNVLLEHLVHRCPCSTPSRACTASAPRSRRCVWTWRVTRASVRRAHRM